MVKSANICCTKDTRYTESSVLSGQLDSVEQNPWTKSLYQSLQARWFRSDKQLVTTLTRHAKIVSEAMKPEPGDDGEPGSGLESDL